MSSLFRKQVLEKQARRHLGDVIIATPLSFKAITALLAALMTAVIIFITAADYSRSVKADGVLSQNPDGWAVHFELSPANADKLEQGQSIRLFYEGFPHQDYGVQRGIILSISNQATPNVAIVVRPEFDKAAPPPFTLRSGMKVTADMTLERKKLWQLGFGADTKGAGAKGKP